MNITAKQVIILLVMMLSLGGLLSILPENPVDRMGANAVQDVNDNN